MRARADMTNNGMARSIIGEVVASVVLSMPTVERPTCFDEPLSAVGEEEPELVTSRMESGLPLSQEFALKIASADMEPDILSLPDRVPRGELRVSETGFEDDGDNNDDGYARSSILRTEGVLLDSSEQEEDDEQDKDEMEDELEEEEEENEEDDEEEEESVDNSLLLPAPVAVSDEDRNSMTTRLVQILRGLDDPLAAVRGEYLARNCSLSRCEDNGHLAWHEVLGEGAFGRVTLVSHELGKYAVKELTEVSVWLPVRNRVALVIYRNSRW